MPTRYRLGTILLIVLAVLATLATPTAAQTSQRCFSETGQCMSGVIRQYWERNGGLPVFGFPTAPQSVEDVEGTALQVQWFERDRLEIQPDGHVTAGRLGARLLDLRGTPWQRGDGSGGDGCKVFAETGHKICGTFRSYWERNGGLERFGYPITGAFTEQRGSGSFLVQYFERRRMEAHPENAAPYDILLGLLGNEVRSAQSNLPGGVHPFVSEVIALTNQARQANGCQVTLTMNDRLNQAAQAHTEDMARRSYFSHTSPEGTNPGDRISATGYSWMRYGENIGAGYATPTDVVNGWLNSTGHRENILNCAFTEIGVGFFYRADDPKSFANYWTQVLATPR